MKVTILFLLALISYRSFSQDCGDVKDGTVYRLDSEGKSLAHSRVQDQDGLGTCYANTASLLLQSALPNNPEVSYLHLSFDHAENLIQKEYRSQGKSQALKDNGDLMLEAGFSCEAINVARDRGGVCERRDVSLEQMMFRTDINQFADPNSTQHEILKSVSTYYDGILRDFSDKKGVAEGLKPKVEKRPEAKSSLKNIFSRLFGIKGDDKKEEDNKIEEKVTIGEKPDEKPEEKTGEQANVSEKEQVKNQVKDKDSRFNQYRDMLKKVIDENREQYSKKSCEKVDTKNAEKVAENLMMRIQNQLNANQTGGYSKSQLKLFQIRLGFTITASVNDVPVVQPKLDTQVLKHLQEDYIKRLTSETNKPASAKAAFKEALRKIDPASPPKMIDDLVEGFSKDDLDLLDLDFKRYVKKDYSYCAPFAKIEYLKSDDGLLKDFSGAGCNGEFVKHVKNLQQMIIGLDKYNFNNIDRLNEFIEKLPTMSYDQAMMQLLAPDCTPEKKIKIPKNLSCNSKAVTYPGRKTDDAETTAQNLAAMKKDFHRDVTSSLQNNKAVGVSMCTGYFTKESAEDFYNKTHVCDETKKHGYHAVTMIGYKCEKGQMKYLIQNSWGAWDQANDRFEKDSHGKAWIKDDELVKNTYQLDLIN